MMLVRVIFTKLPSNDKSSQISTGVDSPAVHQEAAAKKTKEIENYSPKGCFEGHITVFYTLQVLYRQKFECKDYSLPIVEVVTSTHAQENYNELTLNIFL